MAAADRDTERTARVRQQFTFGKQGPKEKKGESGNFHTFRKSRRYTRLVRARCAYLVKAKWLTLATPRRSPCCSSSARNLFPPARRPAPAVVRRQPRLPRGCCADCAVAERRPEPRLWRARPKRRSSPCHNRQGSGHRCEPARDKYSQSVRLRPFEGGARGGAGQLRIPAPPRRIRL